MAKRNLKPDQTPDQRKYNPFWFVKLIFVLLLLVLLYLAYKFQTTTGKKASFLGNK